MGKLKKVTGKRKENVLKLLKTLGMIAPGEKLEHGGLEFTRLR